MSLLARSLAPSRLPSLRIGGPRVHVSLGWLLLGWLVTRVLGVLVWLVLHPRSTLALAAVTGWAYAYLRHGWVALVLPPLAVGLVLGPWAFLAPSSWDRVAVTGARSWWRRTAVYRREWQPAIVTSDLELGDELGGRLPRLGRVRSGPSVDVVRVRMLPGQVVTDWQHAAPRLARTFGVLDVRPRTVPGRPGEVELRCLRRDPLEAVVPLAGLMPGGSHVAVDLEALPVALREDGGRYDLRLLRSHVLVGGETGAGKGSVLWSIVASVAPAIREGVVRVWAIDPKGGLELGAGRDLFTRLVVGGSTTAGVPWQTEIAEVLEDRVRGMQARLARLRGETRLLEPTVRDPLVLILVDELASLTAYVTDAALRARITAALSILLSQGRAPGVVVVAATQDVRKEVVGMRDLFPTRIALRTAEQGAADLLLGRGAYERGARTDRISKRAPGVGFVLVDGEPEPVRVRFPYVSDDAIAELADRYAPIVSAP